MVAEVLAFLHSRLILPINVFTAELRASFLDDVAELGQVPAGGAVHLNIQRFHQLEAFCGPKIINPI